MIRLILDIFKCVNTISVMPVVSTIFVSTTYAADKALIAGKPNSQMQAVLDELAILGPGPLGSLTAIEARKQPSPADAVKALLKKRANRPIQRWLVKWKINQLRGLLVRFQFEYTHQKVKDRFL
jgi:hypothetical protein